MVLDYSWRQVLLEKREDAFVTSKECLCYIQISVANLKNTRTL